MSRSSLQTLAVSCACAIFLIASCGTEPGGNTTPAAKFRITKSSTYNTPTHIQTIISYTYDAAGNLAEMRYGDSSNNLRMYVLYQYDANHNKTRETNYRFLAGDTSMLTDQSWTYNAANKPSLHEKFTATGTPNGKETWTYDAAGHVTRYENFALSTLSNYTLSTWVGNNLMRADNYSGANVLQSSDTFTYDQSGNQTGSVHLLANGTMWNYNLSTYDASAHLLTQMRYNASSALTGGTRNTYSGALLMKTEELDSLSQVTSSVDYTYNSSGKRTEEISKNAAGTQTGRKTYAYDADGNQIEYVEYNANAALVTKIVSEYEQY